MPASGSRAASATRRGRRSRQPLCMTLRGFACARPDFSRPVPPVRCRRAAASRSARLPASPCWSGPRPKATRVWHCSATARPATDTICRPRTRRALGALAAMRQALRIAGVWHPMAIDYVNLHGTGTRANDAMEDIAVAEVFGTATPCSSTKGWSGHTLGASGILEALIACLSSSITCARLPRLGALGSRHSAPACWRRMCGAGPSRDEQCVRFWRHQLQPDLRLSDE